MNGSTIFRKTVMALTGLALLGFLFTHLAGNLQLFAGAGTFNQYAGALEKMPMLIFPAEILLLIFFVVHIIAAIQVTLLNKSARPQNYDVRHTAGESTLASRTMMITGLIVLAFVIWHVWSFKFGVRPADTAAPEGSLWLLVITEFQKPIVAALYVLCMIALGFHLSHGIASAFQTLGLLHIGWRSPAKKVGYAIGWLVAIGFAVLPIWGNLAKHDTKPVIIVPQVVTDFSPARPHAE